MVKKYTLLRSQRKRVFDLLGEAGLEPADFSWSEREELGGSILVSRLEYCQWDYYFQFSWYEPSSWCIVCPGRHRSLDWEHPKNWEEQEGFFRAWGERLRQEIETPDPWTELSKFQIAMNDGSSGIVSNETISGYEAQHIAERLDRLADQIEKELRLDERHAMLVRGRLGYLAEAAKRLKSGDWLYAALGVSATLSMMLSLDPDAARKLWEQVAAQIREVIHMPAPGKHMFLRH